MSPTKHHHEEKMIAAAALRGPRPSPLRINNESHIIQKSSSSSSVKSNSSPSMIVPAPLDGSKQQQRIKQPVIIYTHSPKVIHTQARDFMALVQKLTGFTPPGNDAAGDNESKPPSSQQSKANKRNPVGEKDASAVLTDENSGSRGAGGRGGGGGGGIFPFLAPPSNPLFAEIPLFTPNSSADFFCLHRPEGGSPAEPVYPSPNSGGGSLSPLFEFMKGRREY